MDKKERDRRMAEKIIDVQDLRVSFRTYAGKVQAVRGVSLTVYEGEVLAVVGESGCGKSVTAQSILGLNPTPPAVVEGGSILFEGTDILSLKEKEMCAIRGNKIGMIFQDPMTSLDPTKKVGYQMTEAILQHEKVTKKEAQDRAVELLRQVGISDPERRMNQYPFEFSGGMRQRVMIASTLGCHPRLLIADEPTTALDVTIQAQIIDLLLELRKTMGMSIMIITHDMGVVADIADRVAVMYAGKIVESGTVKDIFYRPAHPYTWGLLESLPDKNGKTARLEPIEGTPPDLIAPPQGCPFADRCAYCMNICHRMMPEEYVVSGSGNLAEKEYAARGSGNLAEKEYAARGSGNLAEEEYAVPGSGKPSEQNGMTHVVRCWLQHPDAPKVNRKLKSGIYNGMGRKA